MGCRSWAPSRRAGRPPEDTDRVPANSSSAGSSWIFCHAVQAATVATAAATTSEPSKRGRGYPRRGLWPAWAPMLPSPPQPHLAERIGSGGWIRTNDQRINSPLRYRCATPDQPRSAAIATEPGRVKPPSARRSTLRAAAGSADRPDIGQCGRTAAAAHSAPSPPSSTCLRRERQAAGGGARHLRANRKGRGRNRTGIHGFAVRCITTLPRGHAVAAPLSGSRPRGSSGAAWRAWPAPGTAL